MKLEIDRDALLSLLDPAAAVAPPKSPQPLLQCVELAAGDDTLAAFSTNLEHDVRAVCGCKVAKPGKVGVRCKEFCAMVRALPPGPVKLEEKERYLVLTSGKRKLKTQTVDVSELPRRPPVEPTATVTVNGFDLAQAIGRARHAVSTDDTRANICAVMCRIGDDDIVTLSSDGRQGVIQKSPGPSKRLDVLIPNAALPLVLEALEDDQVKLAVSPGRLTVSAPQRELTVALADGVFPPLEKVIPTAHEVEARVNGPALLDAIKAVTSAATEDKDPDVGLRICADHVSLSYPPDRDKEASASATDEVPCEAIGKESSVKLSAKYLCDALKHHEGEVRLFFVGELDPFVIRSDDGFMGFVMPRRS